MSQRAVRIQQTIQHLARLEQFTDVCAAQAGDSARASGSVDGVDGVESVDGVGSVDGVVWACTGVGACVHMSPPCVCVAQPHLQHMTSAACLTHRRVRVLVHSLDARTTTIMLEFAEVTHEVTRTRRVPRGTW